MGVHDGHRQRLKTRFENEGLENFEDHNVLELLLFYSIPRMDTNETAHKLLEEFGSLSGVFDAPFDALCQVKGVSSHTATLIKMVPRLFSRYSMDKVNNVEVIDSVSAAGKYISPRFYGKMNEEVHLILLDDKFKILKTMKVFEGTVNATYISVKKLVAAIVNTHATNVIIAHNHPSSFALPSRSDIESTKRIYEALKVLDIRLLDHLIISDDDFISFSDSKYVVAGKYR